MSFQIVSNVNLRLRPIDGTQIVNLPPGIYPAFQEAGWLVTQFGNQLVGLPLEVWQSFIDPQGINCELRKVGITGLTNAQIEFPELTW